MPSPAEKKQLEAPRAPLGEVSTLTSTEPGGSTKAHAKAVRRARSRRLTLRLVLFVLLPTLAASVYYGFMASKQYDSHAVFTVQSSEMRPSLGFEGLLAGVVSGNAGRDVLAVRDYIISRDMLAKLDKQHAIIAHFSDQRQDFFSRLRKDASFEDAYEYYGDKVSVDYDQVTGSIALRVRAFSPDKAVELSRSILAASEDMVNSLSNRERQDSTTHAETDLKNAEARLSQARARITTLQTKHADFNPLQTATATLQLRTQLEAELAKARAELMQLRSFMKDDAPQVLAAKGKVESLSAQVSDESRRLVDPTNRKGLSASFADFEAAMAEKEFSQKAYESALVALEMARASAARQHRYLAIVANPSRPDASMYPRRLRSVFAAFCLSFLLFGVMSLIIAAVREHARL